MYICQMFEMLNIIFMHFLGRYILPLQLYKTDFAAVNAKILYLR